MQSMSGPTHARTRCASARTETRVEPTCWCSMASLTHSTRRLRPSTLTDSHWTSARPILPVRYNPSSRRVPLTPSTVRTMRPKRFRVLNLSRLASTRSNGTAKARCPSRRGVAGWSSLQQRCGPIANLPFSGPKHLRLVDEASRRSTPSMACPIRRRATHTSASGDSSIHFSSLRAALLLQHLRNRFFPESFLRAF